MSFKTVIDSSEKYVLTAEIDPPVGTDLKTLDKKIELYRDKVHILNISENRSRTGMSSFAAALYIKNAGLEPVMQVVTRDKNRIALISDLIGACAHGIKNVLCLSGDHQKLGVQAPARGVFDIDSIQLLNMLSEIMEKGKLPTGEELEGKLDVFPGATANPFGDPLELRIIRLKKKIRAGAKFIQTQPVFDTERFKEWIDGINNSDISDKPVILAGITPLKSLEKAKMLSDKYPGVYIPESIMKRLSDLPEERQKEEGISIALDIVEKLKKVDGVRGFHFQGFGDDEFVVETISQSGLTKTV